MKPNLKILMVLAALCATLATLQQRPASGAHSGFPSLSEFSNTTATLEEASQKSYRQCSPFSISGITLGMPLTEVQRRVGSLERQADSSDSYWQVPKENCWVRFDQSGHVDSVFGDFLERDGVDFTPSDSGGPLPADFEQLLSSADWTAGKHDDLATEWGYDGFHLVVRHDCVGWLFFLDQNPRTVSLGPDSPHSPAPSNSK